MAKSIFQKDIVIKKEPVDDYHVDISDISSYQIMPPQEIIRKPVDDINMETSSYHMTTPKNIKTEPVDECHHGRSDKTDASWCQTIPPHNIKTEPVDEFDTNITETSLYQMTTPRKIKTEPVDEYHSDKTDTSRCQTIPPQNINTGKDLSRYLESSYHYGGMDNKRSSKDTYCSMVGSLDGCKHSKTQYIPYFPSSKSEEDEIKSKVREIKTEKGERRSDPDAIFDSDRFCSKHTVMKSSYNTSIKKERDDNGHQLCQNYRTRQNNKRQRTLQESGFTGSSLRKDKHNSRKTKKCTEDKLDLALCDESNETVNQTMYIVNSDYISMVNESHFDEDLDENNISDINSEEHQISKEEIFTGQKNKSLSRDSTRSSSLKGIYSHNTIDKRQQLGMLGDSAETSRIYDYLTQPCINSMNDRQMVSLLSNSWSDLKGNKENTENKDVDTSPRDFGVTDLHPEPTITAVLYQNKTMKILKPSLQKKNHLEHLTKDGEMMSTLSDFKRKDVKNECKTNTTEKGCITSDHITEKDKKKQETSEKKMISLIPKQVKEKKKENVFTFESQEQKETILSDINVVTEKNVKPESSSDTQITMQNINRESLLSEGNSVMGNVGKESQHVSKKMVSLIHESLIKERSLNETEAHELVGQCDRPSVSMSYNLNSKDIKRPYEISDTLKDDKSNTEKFLHSPDISKEKKFQNQRMISLIHQPTLKDGHNVSHTQVSCKPEISDTLHAINTGELNDKETQRQNNKMLSSVSRSRRKPLMVNSDKPNLNLMTSESGVSKVKTKGTTHKLVMTPLLLFQNKNSGILKDVSKPGMVSLLSTTKNAQTMTSLFKTKKMVSLLSGETGESQNKGGIVHTGTPGQVKRERNNYSDESNRHRIQINAHNEKQKSDSIHQITVPESASCRVNEQKRVNVEGSVHSNTYSTNSISKNCFIMKQGDRYRITDMNSHRLAIRGDKKFSDCLKNNTSSKSLLKDTVIYCSNYNMNSQIRSNDYNYQSVLMFFCGKCKCTFNSKLIYNMHACV